jgi:hypothetical protein
MSHDNEWISVLLQGLILGILGGVAIFFITFCITMGYRAADGLLHSFSSSTAETNF